MKLNKIAQLILSQVPGEGETPQLQVNYADLEAIPEAFRPLYSQGDNGYNLTAVVGIKTQADVNNVMNALTKERNDHGAVKTQMQTLLNGRTVEEMQTLLDSVPALEAAANGGQNVDELVQGKLTQHTAPVIRERDTALSRVQELEATVAQYQFNESRRSISDAISKGATATKARQEAVDDIVMLGHAIFEVNEVGEIVAKKDVPGVTPGISPEVWLTDMKQKKPYFWPESKNAGGRGGNGMSGVDNPFSYENWNMTEQSRLVQNDPAKAKQLAEVAGTTVGGGRPAAPKN